MNAREFKLRKVARLLPWIVCGQLLLPIAAHSQDERALSTDAQPYGELFVIQADGTGLRQLTDKQWEDGTPMWFSESLGKLASSDASQR